MKIKMLGKLLLCAILIVTSIFGAVGCRRDGGEAIDTNKTQLYIYNYNGGIGTNWLYKIEQAFETEYENYEFEKGKKGIQIIIQANKDFDSDNFNFDQSICHIAFCEKLTSSYFVNNNNLLDLTNVMNKILEQPNVALSDDVKEALLFKDKEHYYAIPHYEGGGGVIYDKDLFNKKGLYIGAEGGYVNAEEPRSVGPDGVPNTSDDGLPATYEEFLNLCAQMKKRSVTPFIISGENRDQYYAYFLDRAAAAYNGNRLSRANYTMNLDDMQYVESLTPNNNTLFGYDLNLNTTNLSEENGYLLKQTAGNYYALSMFRELVAKKYYDTTGWSATTSHTDAQEYFLKSSTPLLTNYDPIAMLFDGVWWENEAKDIFERMEKSNSKYSAKNRNFGWMPLPTKLNADDTNTNGNPMATLDSVCAFAIARKDVSAVMKILIETFLIYTYQQENLEAFTVETGMSRVFQYKLSDDNYNKLTTFQKEIRDLHKANNYIYRHGNSELVTMNDSSLFGSRWEGNKLYRNPCSEFAKANSITGKVYFDDMWISETRWLSKYDSYFGDK